MTLKATVRPEDIENLPEPIRNHYREQDGAYVLDIGNVA
jgi:hypothetical protein